MQVVTAHIAVDLWPVAIGLFVVTLVRSWRRKRSLSYLFCFSIFGIYLLLAIEKTFFPLQVSGPYVDVMRERPFMYYVNLVPFYFGPYGTLSLAFPQLMLNVLLTIPFGFGVSFVAPVRPKSFLWLAPAVGLGIEAMQLAISLVLRYPYRVIDINDTLMNTLGVLSGYVAFRVFAWLYLRISQRLRVPHRGLAAYLYEVASRANTASKSLSNERSLA